MDLSPVAGPLGLGPPTGVVSPGTRPFSGKFESSLPHFPPCLHRGFEGLSRPALHPEGDSLGRFLPCPSPDSRPLSPQAGDYASDPVSPSLEDMNG